MPHLHLLNYRTPEYKKNAAREQELLEFNHICFAYPHAAPAAVTAEAQQQGTLSGRELTLDNVSFAVAPGEWVVVLGANGSGKSTLARLANGLLVPSQGEVVADGISCRQPGDVPLLRRRVGLVAQDPDNQLVSTTVADEVAFGPQNLGWSPEDIRTATSLLLAAVGLPEHEFARRDPTTLSGGEKQRLVIAAACAMAPRYLVLDEPTALLDPTNRAAVLACIARQVASGTGVLQSTHVLAEASSAHRVLVLFEGRLVYEGSPDGILSDSEALARYGLMATPRHADAPVADKRQAGRQQASGQQSTPHAGTPHADVQRARFATEPTWHNRLELKQLSVSYRNGTVDFPALSGLDLLLSPGDCLLLTGASGSGKSSLLLAAAGLLKPSSGKVLLSVAPLPPKPAPPPRPAFHSEAPPARPPSHPGLIPPEPSPPQPGELGLVFQHPESQLFAQTVAEDILFGPRNLGLATAGEAGQQIIARVLNAVGLDPQQYAHRSPFSLSGGEARRVALATILALDAPFLLFDEPTAGLDARGKAFVYDLVFELLAQGKGLIIATHDPAYFEPLATHHLTLAAGRVVEQ